MARTQRLEAETTAARPLGASSSLCQLGDSACVAAISLARPNTTRALCMPMLAKKSSDFTVIRKTTCWSWNFRTTF